jgi:hypothetical protein
MKRLLASLENETADEAHVAALKEEVEAAMEAHK